MEIAGVVEVLGVRDRFKCRCGECASVEGVNEEDSSDWEEHDRLRMGEGKWGEFMRADIFLVGRVEFWCGGMRLHGFLCYGF